MHKDTINNTQILSSESTPAQLQVQIATFAKETAYQVSVLNEQIATLITLTRELTRKETGRAGSGT